MTMMTPATTAELDARKARARFLGTAAAMKERLEPSHLIGDAVTGARSGLTGLVRGAAGKASHRPVTAAATVAGVLLFLMRGPLYLMIRKARR